MALATVSNSVGHNHDTRVASSREATQIAFCTAGEPPRIFCVMSNRQQQTDHQNCDRRFSLRMILWKIELLIFADDAIETRLHLYLMSYKNRIPKPKLRGPPCIQSVGGTVDCMGSQRNM